MSFRKIFRDKIYPGSIKYVKKKRSFKFTVLERAFVIIAAYATLKLQRPSL